MTQLGKFEIIEELGRGGFGVVHKARDHTLERIVALKVLHPQLTIDSFIDNFHREARNLAKIHHPNVVTVHEIGEENGNFFIAMAYQPGGSLESMLKGKGALPIDKARMIIKGVSAGLEAGHNQKIIHQDVKPGNILFDEGGKAIVADFGLARAVEISSQGPSMLSQGSVGTPFYRPPELWRGTIPPSPATDVYSLACVLYEMLTGEVLFKGDSRDQVMTRHVLDDAFDLVKMGRKEIPEFIQEVLIKALSKNPQDRYQSTRSFSEALSQAKGRREPIVKSKAKPSNQPKTETNGNYQKLPNDQSPVKNRMPKWLPFLLTAGFMSICVLVTAIVLFQLLGGLTSTSSLGNEAETIIPTETVASISDSQQATEITIFIQSTSPPSEQDIQPQIEYSTPTLESLPSSPVSAGVPISFGGWSMTVSPEINIDSRYNTWWIEISIRNMSETNRVFRFMNSAVTAMDDLGNNYGMSTKGPYGNNEICTDYYHHPKNLQINSGELKKITSGSFILGGSYCTKADGIHIFEGPISFNASHLIINFGDFGPFNGVEVIIDL